MRKVDRGAKAPSSLSRKTKGLTEFERAQAFYLPAASQAAPPAPLPPNAGAAAVTTAKLKKFKFAAYKGSDVKLRLEELFHGKCAYCESRYASTAPIDVEHFRPKGRVKDEKAHGGYWWLAMRWENLLPSCIDCNRRRKHATPLAPALSGSAHGSPGAVTLQGKKGTYNSSRVLTTGKGDAFPIRGTRLQACGTNYASEQALLLNPCDDTPDDHLEFLIDATNPIGLVLAKSTDMPSTNGQLPSTTIDKHFAGVAQHALSRQLSERGAVSIQVYGLNRLPLVRDRTRVLRRLEFLEAMIIKIAGVIAELSRADPAAPCACDHQNAIDTLNTMNDMVIGEIRTMCQDDQPYSVMVQAWRRDFIARVKHPGATIRP